MNNEQLRILGKRTYKAYADSVQWTNPAGNPLPPWDDLGAREQNAWVQAGLEARGAVIR